MNDNAACANTDREIWRGPDEGNGSYYADSIHITKEGRLGINCGGLVHVRPIREWHRMAGGPIDMADDPAEMLDSIGKLMEQCEKLREMLATVMRQSEIDLKSAHAEICKLQGLDPDKHTWPQWTPQANSLRWYVTVREKFGIE